MPDFNERLKAQYRAQEQARRDEERRIADEQRAAREAQRNAERELNALRKTYPGIIRQLGIERMISDIARTIGGRTMRVNGRYSEFVPDGPRGEDPNVYETFSQLLGHAVVLRESNYYKVIFAGFSDDSLGVGRGTDGGSSQSALSEAGITGFQSVEVPNSRDSVESTRSDIENILLSLVY